MKETITITVGVLIFFGMLFYIIDAVEQRSHELKIEALKHNCVVID